MNFYEGILCRSLSGYTIYWTKKISAPMHFARNSTSGLLPCQPGKPAPMTRLHGIWKQLRNFLAYLWTTLWLAMKRLYARLLLRKKMNSLKQNEETAGNKCAALLLYLSSFCDSFHSEAGDFPCGTIAKIRSRTSLDYLIFSLQSWYTPTTRSQMLSAKNFC